MNTTYRIRTKTLLAAAVAAFLAMPAAAHFEGGMMQGWRWGGGAMGYGPGAMFGGIESRLAFLKSEHKITVEQSAEWDTMSGTVGASVAAHAETMHDMFRQLQDGTYQNSGLPARLAFQERHMAAQLDEIRKIKASVEALYAVLDEDQKKAADAMALPVMGFGMMGPGMMGYGARDDDVPVIVPPGRRSG